MARTVGESACGLFSSSFFLSAGNRERAIFGCRSFCPSGAVFCTVRAVGRE